MDDIVLPVADLSVAFYFLSRIIMTVDVQARVVGEVAEFDLIEVFQEHVVCRGLIPRAIRRCCELPFKVLFFVWTVGLRVFIFQYHFLCVWLMLIDGVVLARSHLLKQSCLMLLIKLLRTRWLRNA